MALVDSNRMIATSMLPKFKYRFIMDIDGIPSALIKRAKKPQVRNNLTEIHYLNNTVYYKGRSKMLPATFTIIDAIDPNMVATIQLWQLLHNDPATGIDGSKAIYAIKLLALTLIGPSGLIVNKWTYHNCWLTDVDFGENDADDDSAIGLIAITVRYDYYTVLA